MTKADDKTREELQAEHDWLIGEGGSNVDDPLRDFDKVEDVFVTKTVNFIQGDILQQLPKSSKDSYLKKLKAAL